MAFTDAIEIQVMKYIKSRMASKFGGLRFDDITLFTDIDSFDDLSPNYEEIVFDAGEYITDKKSIAIIETAGTEVDGGIDYEKLGFQLIFQDTDFFALKQQMRRVKNILIKATLHDLKEVYGSYRVTGFSSFGTTINLGKSQGGYWAYSQNYIMSKNGIGDDD